MTEQGAQVLVDALGAGQSQRGLPARRLAELAGRVRARVGRTSVPALADEIGAWGRAHRQRRPWLADRIRAAVGVLAVDGVAPRRGYRREAWQAAVAIAAALYPSSVHRVRIARAVGPEILAALAREAARRRPRGQRSRTEYSAPGPILQRLAVDPLLREAASAAAGCALRPAYRAVYMYDPPGSAVPPHLDTADFELVLHIVLSHEGARPGRGSALVVHGPLRRRRLPVAAGEAVLLCGRGAVHQWEPLGPREARKMLAIGYIPARPRR